MPQVEDSGQESRTRSKLVGIPLVALLIVAVLSIAGCGGAKERDPIELIPTGSTFVAKIQVAEILKDERINALLGEFAGDDGAFQTLDDLLDLGQEETGVDLRQFDDVVAFGDIAQRRDLESGVAFIIRGRFGEEDLVAGLENAYDESLSLTQYKKHRVHADGDGDLAVVFLSADTVALGGLSAVRSVIDVWEGDKDRASGELYDSFRVMGDPLIRLAFEVPSGATEELEGLLDEVPIPVDLDLFEDIDVISVATDLVSDSVRVEAHLDFGRASSAERAADAIDGLFKLVGALSGGEEIRRLLKKVQVSTTDTRLNVFYEAKLSDVKEALDSFEGGIQEYLPLPLRLTGRQDAAHDSTPAPGETGGEGAGHHNYDSLLAGLRGAGLSVGEGGESSDSPFSVNGKTLLVDGGVVQVFQYADEGSAATEAAGVSPDGHVIETESATGAVASDVMWVATPHFYKGGRLIVLYVGDDPEVTKALEAAMGPQFAGG